VSPVSEWLSRFATPAVRWVALLGLCAAYLQGGIVKLANINGAVAEMNHFGLSPGMPFAIAVATVTASFMANRYWELGSAERFAAENSFYEHLGLAGGFLLVAWYDLCDRRRQA
jgi:uncharacterized membrane protein YphA (DoxX/SURF4 family)